MEKIRDTSDYDCCECMFADPDNGSCNIESKSGYEHECDREDPNDEYNWLPCKWRIDYNEFIQWYKVNRNSLVEEPNIPHPNWGRK